MAKSVPLPTCRGPPALLPERARGGASRRAKDEEEEEEQRRHRVPGRGGGGGRGASFAAGEPSPWAGCAPRRPAARLRPPAPPRASLGAGWRHLPAVPCGPFDQGGGGSGPTDSASSPLGLGLGRLLLPLPLPLLVLPPPSSCGPVTHLPTHHLMGLCTAVAILVVVAAGAPPRGSAACAGAEQEARRGEARRAPLPPPTRALSLAFGVSLPRPPSSLHIRIYCTILFILQQPVGRGGEPNQNPAPLSPGAPWGT